uniref:Chlorophyll a-b binding proteinic n=1 Tax=Rhizophora mucronata TaxID=61149 RepID=A0A2P2L080_RHIMU
MAGWPCSPCLVSLCKPLSPERVPWKTSWTTSKTLLLTMPGSMPPSLCLDHKYWCFDFSNQSEILCLDYDGSRVPISRF